MAVGLEVDTLGDIEILAALEGAEPAQVHEHGLVDLRVRRDCIDGHSNGVRGARFTLNQPNRSSDPEYGRLWPETAL